MIEEYNLQSLSQELSDIGKLRQIAERILPTEELRSNSADFTPDDDINLASVFDSRFGFGCA
jgi:hypothetical protein